MSDIELPNGYIEFFDQVKLWGRNYESLSPGERSRIDSIVELFPEDAKTLLDVGCADGIVANRLLDLGAETTGVDLSSAALHYVRGTAIQAPSHDLPFGDKSFDCAIAADLLEHLPARSFEETLAELARVSARYLIINCPHREDLVLAQSRCDHCQTAFHASRHLRSIDESAVASWFPGFAVLASRLAGEPWPYRSRRLHRIAQLVGNVWYRTETVCPMCGYPVDPPVPNLAVRTVHAGIQRLLGRIRGGRPSELIVLLERR